jgi:low affinity Fe/Cu permease
MDRLFEAMGSKVASWAGRPLAFVVALAVVILWGVTGPLFGWSDTWQLVINTGTTIVTFLMVFLIQSAQNRDASALQAKLDELIRAVDKARNAFIGVEHLSEQELRAVLRELERDYGVDGHDAAAVRRLIVRRGGGPSASGC